MDGAGGYEWQQWCWTPADKIICGDGQNYTELAMQLNRVYEGKYYGCACGEGIFRDYVCPVYEDRGSILWPPTTHFSISYFISTPSGTGAMAAFCIWPQVVMWHYGFSNPETMERTLNLGQLSPVVWFNEDHYKIILRMTLVLFQFFFGLFLMNTLCVAPALHMFSVGGFLLFAILHYVAICLRVGYKHPLAC